MYFIILIEGDRHLKKVMLIFTSLLLLLTILPMAPTLAAAEPVVKVKLKNYLGSHNAISIKVNHNYTTNFTGINLAPGQDYQVKVENGSLSLYSGITLLGSASVISASSTSSGSTLYVNGRPYLGNFDFTIENGTIVRPINYVDLEDYVKGVVPFEMSGSWPIEALKTQAVAARTYAFSYNGSVIDDTINYQVYGGYDWHPNATAAVDATFGQILKYNGRLISAVFSASNGGMTESNANVWGTASAPYLTIKSDPYDPKTPWDFTIQKTQIDMAGKDLSKPELWWDSANEADTVIANNIKTWLKNNGFANKDIKIVSVPSLSLYAPTSGGRVSKGAISLSFYVKDLKDSTGKLALQQINYKDVPASRIRAMVGIRTMLSYLVETVNDTPASIHVQGFGDGHGVGMSQWGAEKRALAGQSYKNILGFYYVGAVIEQAYDQADAPPDVIPPVQPPADTIPPVIKDVTTAYDSKTKHVTAAFTTDEASAVTVYVKDKTGKIIGYLLNNVSKPAGKQTANWDVTKIANGAYTFGIITVDKSGNRASVAKPYTLNQTAAKPAAKPAPKPPAKKPAVKKPAPKKLTGIVNAAKLTVRNGASTKYKAAGYVKKNQKVTILKKSGSWYQIQYGKLKGYVSGKYLKSIR